ncbi:hypothetical protein BDV93DRAFT_504079 [Ceratobasidium sp. AG-I]|nr:hypothetical protein BDV93DRAFT_504079 [Ceratobasidium sp. AG-I]
MSNYRRDSFSDRDVDDYSDHQPGNILREDRGQPPLYRDDRFDRGAEVRNHRREYRRQQPTMEENLVALALLNARNERDRARFNLINRGGRPFHAVRRGTRGGARRGGHGGPPRFPPHGDEPVRSDAKRRRSSSVSAGEESDTPRTDRRRSADTPRGPSPERGRSSKRSRGQADRSSGDGVRDRRSSDHVSYGAEEAMLGSERANPGGGSSGSGSHGSSSSSRASRPRERNRGRGEGVNSQLERIDHRGSDARTERGRAVSAHTTTERGVGALTSSRGYRPSVPELSIHRASGAAEVLRAIPDSSTVGPGSDTEQSYSSGSEGTSADDGVRRRKRDGGSYGTTNQPTDGDDARSETGLTEILEKRFIDYEAGAARKGPPDDGAGVPDVDMSVEPVAPECEPIRFVSPRDLEIKSKSDKVSNSGSHSKCQGNGKELGGGD